MDNKIRKGLIFTNTANFIPENLSDSIIIAVDGGYDFLAENTITPDIVIGDFDSIKDPKIVGEEFLFFGKDKDQTDTELAIDYCKKKNINDVIIINSLRKRFDHTLGVISNLILANRYKLNAIIESKTEIVALINQRFLIPKGKSFSIIPISEIVEIKQMIGCKFEVNNEIFKKESTRGVSNFSLTEECFIEIGQGEALIIINKEGE